MNPDETTAEQVLHWKAAWERVNRFEIEELRTADTTTKIRQLASMMASHHLFESDADRATNVEIVRRRWLQLYRAYASLEDEFDTESDRRNPVKRSIHQFEKKSAPKKKTAKPSRKKSQ